MKNKCDIDKIIEERQEIIEFIKPEVYGNSSEAKRIAEEEKLDKLFTKTSNILSIAFSTFVIGIFLFPFLGTSLALVSFIVMAGVSLYQKCVILKKDNRTRLSKYIECKEKNASSILVVMSITVIIIMVIIFLT